MDRELIAVNRAILLAFKQKSNPSIVDVADILRSDVALVGKYVKIIVDNIPAAKAKIGHWATEGYAYTGRKCAIVLKNVKLNSRVYPSADSIDQRFVELLDENNRYLGVVRRDSIVKIA